MRNKNDDNDMNEKKEFGSTLDYYNDDLSRKAVGKLFAEDGSSEIAATEEDLAYTPPRGRPTYNPGRRDEPEQDITPGRRRDSMDSDMPVSRRESQNMDMSQSRRSTQEIDAPPSVRRGTREMEAGPGPRRSAQEMDMDSYDMDPAPPVRRGTRNLDASSSRYDSQPSELPSSRRQNRNIDADMQDLDPYEEERVPRRPVNEGERRTVRRADEKPERPISNHFYEESRSTADEGDSGIVRGFEKEEDPVPRSRQSVPTGTPSARRRREEVEDDGESMRSDKSDRDKYRRQFLSEMENDPKRNIRKSVDEDDNMKKPSRDPLKRNQQGRPGGPGPNKNKQNQDQYSEEFENAEKRYSQRAAQSSEGGKSSPYQPPRKTTYKTDYQAAVTDKGGTVSILALPVFKFIVAGGVVLLLILIFLTAKLNGLNKELKAFEDSAVEAETSLSQEDIDNLQAKVVSQQDEITRLTGELNAYKMQLKPQDEDEEGLGEGEGGDESAVEGRTHTVASGDTVSSISQKYYGNSSDGVQKIIDANGLPSASLIRTGQVLIIP